MSSRLRAALPRLLAESALIVASILLALAADEWREGRERRERVDEALVRFEREVRQNRRTAAELLPYHLHLQQQFDRAAGERSIRTIDDLGRIEGFRGFRPPFLLDTAWRTALATDVLPHMEYETVSALSRTYAQQERLSAMSDPSYLLGGGALSDAYLPSTTVAVAMYLGDVTSGERQMVDAYDRMLDALEERGIGEGAEDDAG